MKTKNAQTLGVHLADDIVDMIARRAAAHGVTKSRFAAMVFEKWKKDKYPAISTIDSTGRALVKQQLDTEKSIVIGSMKGTVPMVPHFTEGAPDPNAHGVKKVSGNTETNRKKARRAAGLVSHPKIFSSSVGVFFASDAEAATRRSNSAREISRP